MKLRILCILLIFVSSILFASNTYDFDVDSTTSKVAVNIAAEITIDLTYIQLTSEIGSQEKEIAIDGTFNCVYNPVIGDFEFVRVTGVSLVADDDELSDQLTYTFEYECDNANTTLNITLSNITITMSDISSDVEVNDSGISLVTGHTLVLSATLTYNYLIEPKSHIPLGDISGSYSEEISETYTNSFEYTTTPFQDVEVSEPVNGNYIISINAASQDSEDIDMELDFVFNVDGLALAPAGNATGDQWALYE